MKIATLSDLHIDFYIPAKTSGHKLDKKMNDYISNTLCLKHADVLILPGDISHYPSQIQLLLEKIAAKGWYKKIFITFGNHELYLISNKQKSKYKTSWEKIEHIKQICNDIPTVEFLDGNVVEVDGVTFGGTCGWYDFSYGIKHLNMNHHNMMNKWKETMTDATDIYMGDNPIEINDSRAVSYNNTYGAGGFKKYSFDPIKFFKKEQKKIENIIEKCDVFISHIGPFVPNNLPPEFQNVETGFYFFDGEYLLQNKLAPKIWVFGHTHDKYNFKLNNTTLVCNPLGYKSEKKNNKVEVINY